MDTRHRLTVAASLCLAPLLPLTARLARLQVMEHQSLETRAADEFSRSDNEIVPRGDILDRNGFILTQSIPVWACFADKHMVTDARSTAQRLAPLIGMSASEIARKIQSGSRFPWIKTDMSFEQSQAVEKARVEGIGVVASQQRFYPNGDLARGLLGQVNPDGHGASGAELAFDSRLAGKARKFKVIRDGSGRFIYKSVEEDASAPGSLRLTIDRSIQYFAEDALQSAYQQFHMKSGMILVQDPGSGDILAMASYPPNPLENPIVQDPYEPGSTFKVVAAAAGLEEGTVSETDTFNCEHGAYEIAPGVVIHDHEPEAELTLQGILEHSSNIGISKVVQKVGALPFYKAVRAFGFGSKTGIDLPGETSGEMRPLSDLTKVGLAAASYGYGIGVSALQVVGAYSAIANGGVLWQPRIADDGSPVRVRRVLSAETMRRLSRMLEGIVQSGTGTTAKVPGYRLAGKTGTSRRLDPLTKKYSMSEYNASFAGFLPASAPHWTILVVIQAPKGQFYGAQVAAPIFAKLAKRLLTLAAVPPDDPGAALISRPADPPTARMPLPGRLARAR